jgi:hypothetical protein
MRRINTLIIVAAAALASPIHGLEAQTPAVVPDQVEEDWELVVGTPDIIGVGPQITTSMSPVSDNSTPFFAFDLNYREYPSFQAGGMQIQVWDGDNVLSTSSKGSAQFATPGETVTWTQRMSIDEGTVSYQVRNGQSTTWGSFGGSGQLKVSFSTSYDSLSGYSPDTSVSNSGVSWESNYVTSMRLVQVRYYDASGRLISTDSTPRSIISSQ